MIRKQSGFTIIELLVVIAIIGILVALLMPAIQSSRETARQATCVNSLKQIGTAVGNHVGALGRYPTGGWGYLWLGDPDQGNGQGQPGGWIYNLLPYMDQQILHDYGALPFPTAPNPAIAPPLQSITEATWREGGNVIRIMTPLPVFNCPSRRRAINYPYWTQNPTSPSYLPLNPLTQNPFTVGNPSASPPTGYAPPNYCYTSSGASLGIGGQGQPPAIVQPLTGGIARSDYAINSGDAAAIGFNSAPAPLSLCNPQQGPTVSSGEPPATAYPAWAAGAQHPTTYQSLFLANTGVSFQQSMIQPAQITDGANYTILAGEKSLNPARYTNPSALTPGDLPPLGDTFSMYGGAGFDVIRTTTTAPVQDTMGQDGACSFCSQTTFYNANFGSAHPNGVYFVFCDSSVKLIKYGIKLSVYQSLGSRLDATQGTSPPIDDTIFK